MKDSKDDGASPPGLGQPPPSPDELFPVVYDELRAIATRHIARERGGSAPLRPTELVHEAYIRLSSGPAPTVNDRTHFLRLASRAMRQVLVDVARRRASAKRGGGKLPVTLDPDAASDGGHAVDLLELHDALQALGRRDAGLEELVSLRFFTGLTLAESADVLGVSRRKASKDWAAARLWLRRQLAVS